MSQTHYSILVFGLKLRLCVCLFPLSVMIGRFQVQYQLHFLKAMAHIKTHKKLILLMAG